MVKFENIEIKYGDFVAIENLNLDIKEGEFFTFLGPSGCGKTTSLRALVGFLSPSKGKVYVGDKDVTNLPVEKRNIGMVFQSYALFPTMSVYDNIAFGMKVKKASKTEIDQKVHEVAAKIKITESQLKKNVSDLSGGQQQRVALARAIVLEPKILCLDEPLSNLDAKLRNQMRAEIIKLRQRIKSTFLYVTHDQTEAMTLGDRIVIMKDGFIQQIGTPQEVFDQPANLFVAGFIGSPQMNFFDGELEKKDGKYQLKVGEATVVLGGKAQELLTGKGVGERKVTVGIRPEHIAFAAAPGTDTVSSKVDVSEMMGSEVYLHVNAVGRDVVLRIPTTDLPAEHRAGIPYGTEINFAFRPDLIHLFDPETEKNLMY